MADQRVGLVIEVEGDAPKELRKIGDVGKAALTGVRGAAERAGNAMSILGESAAKLNQGLELAKKGAEFFRLIVVDTVASAMEFRKENDEGTKQLREFVRAFEVLRARLGDIFIPILRGVADVLQPILERMSAWLVENQKLVGSGIVDFLANTASILTDGIATGVLLVTKVWHGWNMLIAAGEAAITAYWASLLGGVSQAVDALGSVAAAVGADGIAAGLEKAQEAVDGLGSEFSKSSEEALASMEESSAKLAEQEAAIERVRASVQGAIGQTAVAAQERLASATTGTTMKLEEQHAALEKIKLAEQERLTKLDEAHKRVNAGIEARHQQRLANIQLQEDVAKQADEAAQERTAARIDQAKAMAQAVGTEVTNAFMAAATGAATFEQAMLGALVNVMKMIAQQALAFVINKATEAAASSFQSANEQAGWPWGLIIGAGAAASAFAAVAALQSKIKRFQSGGLVTGGRPGEDSVPALLAPGELVLPTSLVDAIFSVAGKRPPSEESFGFAQGGMVPAAAPSSSMTVNVNATFEGGVPNPAEEARSAMRIGQLIEEQVRNGRLSFAG